MNSDYQQITMSAQDAARYLGISYWLITQMVKKGEIPHIRLGKKIFFRKQTLDQFMDVQEKESSLEN